MTVSTKKVLVSVLLLFAAAPIVLTSRAQEVVNQEEPPPALESTAPPERGAPPTENDKERDKIPPVLSAVEVTQVESTAAIVVWETDEPADSDIDYGVAPQRNLHGPASTELRTSHEIRLTGLSESTSYSFCVTSRDAGNNRTQSCDHSFTTETSVPPDQTPPTITNIALTAITSTGATVHWKTDEITTAQVAYGTTDAYGDTTTLDTALDLTHAVSLSGLLPDTAYHIRIRAADDSDNVTYSEDFIFTTLSSGSLPDTDTPVLSGTAAYDIADVSARISWMTNEPADGQVEYGLTATYGATTPRTTELTLSHDHYLSNLRPDTTHHVRVQSRDRSENLSVSDDFTFTTGRNPSGDPAPIIMQVTATVEGTNVIVTWHTNEPATTQVSYGLTSAYGNSTPKDVAFTTTHTHIISGLTAGATYHFTVASADQAGNTAYSADSTVRLAPSGQDTVPPAAIDDVAVASVDETSALLTWTAPADATGVVLYDVNRSFTSLSEETFDRVGVIHEVDIILDTVEQEGTRHTYRVIGLTPGRTVYLAIKSRDPEGNISSISNVVAITPTTIPVDRGGGGHSSLTNDTAPPRVTGVQAAGLDQSVLLSWVTPGEVTFSRVRIVRSERSYPETPTDGTVIYEDDGKIFSDIGLQNDKTYYYSIFTYDRVPRYSDPVQLSVAPVAERSQYSIVTSEPGKITMLSNDTYGIGHRGPEVEYLQHLLATNPLLYPEGLVTGYFGPLTKAAVMRFQRKYNIPETGMVDADVRAVARNLTIHESVTSNPSVSLDMSIGMEGDSIKKMQQVFARLGYLDEVSITGVFGQATLSAIVNFQRVNGIPTTGIVGPRTRARALMLLGATTTPQQR